MRPQNTIQAMSIINETNNEEKEVSFRVEIGSWMSLRPRKSRGHAKDAKKVWWSMHSRLAYKAKVPEFRLSVGGRLYGMVYQLLLVN